MSGTAFRELCSQASDVEEGGSDSAYVDQAKRCLPFAPIQCELPDREHLR